MKIRAWAGTREGVRILKRIGLVLIVLDLFLIGLAFWVFSVTPAS